MDLSVSNKENGNMLSINLGWGFGVLMGIMVAGPISGNNLDLQLNSWFFVVCFYYIYSN